MAREIYEFPIMILSGSRDEVVTEFARFRQRNKVFFTSMQVTSTADNGVIQHHYHLLVQYLPRPVSNH